MPRQVAKVGDVFWVQIEDDSLVLGQIVEINKEVLNSFTCAFFDIKNNFEDYDLSRPISVQFVTKDLFNRGSWTRVSNKEVEISEDILPYRETAINGWIGATVVGSGIIRNFLSAFYGLRAWDEMHDSSYYQKLLLPDIQRHRNA
ncbi:Imm26 family immunity protein [Vibrio vulnificus]|uniref:Imm26 family immunity protein n=1 Tax=Vibrio TaxID=662 RepID=UPI0002BB959E|nr:MULTISPECIES: Imm26 family immunity protein [Vibrio]EHH2484508.1 hypothetical protein [Vibrio parahaemolyticus]EJL6467373.1 hypothetical protein [Vibrio cholerae]EIF3178480.1 hypothetical protein [Vibrio vulnificus]EIQ1514476.1 hypothetical protein [Vibrio parahaemolyticus]EJE8549635.1 hypothetical protein [Vibrio vulnificus]